MMAKRLYLGRDEGGAYELGTVKKEWCPHDGFKVRGFLKFFCSRLFEKYTNVKLKPGEIRRVKSITIDLEEPS